MRGHIAQIAEPILGQMKALEPCRPAWCCQSMHYFTLNSSLSAVVEHAVLTGQLAGRQSVKSSGIPNHTTVEQEVRPFSISLFTTSACATSECFGSTSEHHGAILKSACHCICFSRCSIVSCPKYDLGALELPPCFHKCSVTHIQMQAASTIS